jgi:hypothetical protein
MANIFSLKKTRAVQAAKAQRDSLTALVYKHFT